MNLENHNDLNRHLQTEDQNRDRNWDEKFFKLISESHLKLLSLDPQQGPDGWPYLMTELIEKSAKDSTVDSFQKLMFWLSQKGIGLVVNPKRLPYPDFVFSYGMLWSFKETGFFVRYDLVVSESNKMLINDSKLVKTGSPTTEYFPGYVRSIVKSFFVDQGVLAPKVLMVSADGQNFDLCFSIESLGNPPESEHSGILEAIAWFLPPHYSLALVSEKNFPQFELL